MNTKPSIYSTLTDMSNIYNKKILFANDSTTQQNYKTRGVTGISPKAHISIPHRSTVWSEWAVYCRGCAGAAAGSVTVCNSSTSVTAPRLRENTP